MFKITHNKETHKLYQWYGFLSISTPEQATVDWPCSKDGPFLYTPKTRRGCFKRGKARGKTEWEINFVWRENVDLLQVENWKTAIRNTEGWVQEIGEAMDRKRAGAP